MSTKKSVSIPLAFFRPLSLVANLPNSIDHKIINFVCHNSFVINSSSSVFFLMWSRWPIRAKPSIRSEATLGIGLVDSYSYVVSTFSSLPHFLSMVIEVMEKL